MSKRTTGFFLVFVAVFTIAIPLHVINGEGSADSSAVKVAKEDEANRKLFQDNCGACHTLKLAATDGIVGPNLDDSTATSTPESVLGFIGGGSGGVMPAGILKGADAERVAGFVSKYAGGVTADDSALP